MIFRQDVGSNRTKHTTQDITTKYIVALISEAVEVDK